MLCFFLPLVGCLLAVCCLLLFVGLPSVFAGFLLVVCFLAASLGEDLKVARVCVPCLGCLFPLFGYAEPDAHPGAESENKFYKYYYYMHKCCFVNFLCKM